MSDSLRSQPRGVRAARRAVFPAVRQTRPSPGRHHPASAADVRRALRAFGKEAYYGLRSVELKPAPAAARRLRLGELVGPGRIVLYDQPRSPWRLGVLVSEEDQARFEAAGASDDQGVVTWPGDSLRRFMLGFVLAHELGHHMLQHERRVRGRRAARTPDHEAYADNVARRLRGLL